MSLTTRVNISGRKSDPVWEHFNRIPSKSGKGWRATCKQCKLELQGIVARLKSHREKCQQLQTTLSEEDLDDPESVPIASTSTPLTPKVPQRSVATPVLQKESPASATSFSKHKATTLDTFVTKTSSYEKANLDEEVAKTVFATNSSFRLVEHPQFCKMVGKLRPGYTPPTRKEIADKFLPMIYEKEYAKCATELKDEIVCLSLDGWSNIHNEPIICITVTTSSGHIYLVDTVDTSGQPHTAEYLQELSKSAIQKCKEELDCHVGSVVTDNAANVNKMRKLLEQENELKLVTYGCTAHILNLLAHDLEIGNIKEHVVNIVKYFRNNHYASARYRQEGEQRLVMPQDTRWNTMCNCLKTYIKNWPALMKICEVNREQIDVRVREKVSNLTLKRSAEDLLARLEPIAVALDKAQSDKCTIAEAVNIWKELITTLCNDRDALTAVRKRYDQVITQAHLLANLIHPSLQGKLLSEEEVNNAMDYANERFPSLVPVIMKFQAKSPPFHAFKFSDFVTKSMSAVEWWRSHSNVLDSDVISAAQQLLSAVASSSGVERVFSSYGIVHSKLRNRLGTEKAAKLVFLFKTMNAHKMDVFDDTNDQDA